MRRVDVAIVGGGPAGLAASIEVARRGLSVLVIERQGETPDKACGEGLLPSGWRALESLGATAFLRPERLGPFAGIRYVQEDGTSVSGRFREGHGTGIRRLDLSAALRASAQASGVELRSETAAHDVRLDANSVRLIAGEGEVEARLLIAADGLASPLRRQFGLEGPPASSRRFGLRRHFRNVRTSGFVDVHWTAGAEAYVTPLGADRCGVAFLYDAGKLPKSSFESLLRLFPVLEQQLAGGVFDSEVRGAGPFLQRVRTCVQGRLVLLGDAAGYVDAITGEGLSLAFESARLLGATLPEALDHPARLTQYERGYQQLFRRYAIPAGALVQLAERPRLRRTLFGLCVRWPALFDIGLRLATGHQERAPAIEAATT